CGYGRSDWSTKLIRGLTSEVAAGFRSRRGPSHDSTLVTPHNAPFSTYKAARVHHTARWRGGVAARGAGAAADWPNRQDAARGHIDARPRRAFSSHSRTFLPWATRTRLHRGAEPSYREARRGLETGSIPCAGG